MNIANSEYAKFKRRGETPDYFFQLDVKKEAGDFTVCNMYTGPLCVEVVMKTSDYKELIRKGFFIRDGKSQDGSNIWNTTDTYIRESDLK